MVEGRRIGKRSDLAGSSAVAEVKRSESSAEVEQDVGSLRDDEVVVYKNWRGEGGGVLVCSETGKVERTPSGASALVLPHSSAGEQQKQLNALLTLPPAICPAERTYRNARNRPWSKALRTLVPLRERCRCRA